MPSQQDDIDDIVNTLLSAAQRNLLETQALLEQIKSRLNKVACIVEDPIDRFLKECCVESCGERVTLTELYQAYVSWCLHPVQQEIPIPRGTLNRILKERLAAWVYRSTWVGLGLKRQPGEGVEPELPATEPDRPGNIRNSSKSEDWQELRHFEAGDDGVKIRLFLS